MRRRILNVIALLVVATATAAVRAGQDQVVDRLGEAKGLYSSAEYERALAVLEEIDSSTASPEQARERVLHQALCLLALNRQREAESRIEEIVRTMPLFRPDREMSPRLRAIVNDVRGRMLPDLVQEHYGSGKVFFDAGDYAEAFREFTLVLQLAEGITDPAPAVLADMTTLAVGFRDLARALGTGSKPDTHGDSTVVPPVTIHQNIPPWPQALRFLGVDQRPSGVLEIVVSPKGDVQSVKLVESIHPLYDALLLSAAKQWKYEPATRAGIPVEFLKRLALNVTAR
jgi:TonB family protein